MSNILWCNKMNKNAKIKSIEPKMGDFITLKDDRKRYVVGINNTYKMVDIIPYTSNYYLDNNIILNKSEKVRIDTILSIDELKNVICSQEFKDHRIAIIKNRYFIEK